MKSAFFFLPPVLYCIKNISFLHASEGDDHLQKASHKPKLTVVSSYHYFRLVYRSALFLAFLWMYISCRLRGSQDISTVLESRPLILSLIWTVFTVEMVLRFFPSRLESPGCQKQFARNYVKTGRTNIDIQDNNGVVLVALIWIAFNALFGALHMSGILDDGIMILLCLAYSVCDMICILFFCPFQSWFLKNKCCCTCRIYNWDYAMMFTPLFFVRKPTPGACWCCPWPCLPAGRSPSTNIPSAFPRLPTVISAAGTAPRSSVPIRTSCCGSGPRSPPSPNSVFAGCARRISEKQEGRYRVCLPAFLL